jgi:hypothetical protein
MEPHKKMKLLKGLQTLCLTVTAAGSIGMMLSFGGNSERYKKLALVSSVAGAGGALGALSVASKRATLAFNDFMKAFEEYQSNSSQNDSQYKINQANQNLYFEDPYINDTR